MKQKTAIIKLCQMIESLALDCSDHLKNQHNQTENDKPRFYFDNIAKQTQELRLELEKKE